MCDNFCMTIWYWYTKSYFSNQSFLFWHCTWWHDPSKCSLAPTCYVACFIPTNWHISSKPWPEFVGIKQRQIFCNFYLIVTALFCYEHFKRVVACIMTYNSAWLKTIHCVHTLRLEGSETSWLIIRHCQTLLESLPCRTEQYNIWTDQIHQQVGICIVRQNSHPVRKQSQLDFTIFCKLLWTNCPGTHYFVEYIRLYTRK